VKTPPLPELATVPPYDYGISWGKVSDDDPEDPDGWDRSIGEVLHAPYFAIRLQEGLPYRVAATTLDHEIGHAVIHASSATSRVTRLVVSWTTAHPTYTENEKIAFYRALEELLVEVTFEAAHAYRRFSPDVVKWIDKGLVKG